MTSKTILAALAAIMVLSPLTRLQAIDYNEVREKTQQEYDNGLTSRIIGGLILGSCMYAGVVGCAHIAQHFQLSPRIIKNALFALLTGVGYKICGNSQWDSAYSINKSSAYCYEIVDLENKLAQAQAQNNLGSENTTEVDCTETN